ncbi:4906_t:CDS:2, partial [Cetraspora pellucida]
YDKEKAKYDEEMEYNEEIVEDTQFESEADSNSVETEEEEPKEVSAVDKLVNRLKLCCSCKNKCSEKISSSLLWSLALERPHKKQTHTKYPLPYFGETMLPPLHGNTDRSPVVKLSVETTEKIKSFIRLIVQYEKNDLVLLPSHYSYNQFLAFYNLTHPDNCVSNWSFRRIWKDDAELSKTIIRKPSKDVCDECTLFKRALKECNNVDENLDTQFAKHIIDYRSMREAYENDIQMAKECNRSVFRVFPFDFTQNVELPHDPQQPGKWYYSSLLKVHQFGLVDEGIDHHWHVLYMEAKASKGANEVTSMIEYRFQIKGHTRNSVDQGFGNTKKEYAKSEVWCIDQLVEVINRSASNNSSVNLDNQTGPFCDWTSSLKLLYYKPPAIQNYHFFQFSSENPDEFKLLKLNVNAESLNPQELLPKGLSEEKQVDIWNNIRPYCPIAFHNKFCSKPSDDLIERVGNRKRACAKEAQQKQDVKKKFTRALLMFQRSNNLNDLKIQKFRNIFSFILFESENLQLKYM